MLFSTPPLSRALRRQLDELDELRARLGDATGVPGPWLGQLRRQVRASTVESSVSIEGFSVPPGEATAIVTGTATPDPRDRDRMAIAGYARAMDHVGVMATDPHFRWDQRVILDLHFDACQFQRDRSPGVWRTTPIAVTGSDGTLAYQAPSADEVPALMAEVVTWLERGDRDSHVAVRAAMAHLHVVSVHPFRDGNGRISRIVQSLVLAREGLLTPEFNSIEEHLGRVTKDYYVVLQRVQGGRYRAERDATPWVRFCIAAHIEQARIRIDQVTHAALRWSALEALATRRDWPERLVIAMEQSVFDGIDRAAYAAEAGISLATATTDIRRLVDAGFVTPVGRTRNARYLASDELRRHITGR
jgi:Fic family protein